ncbi:MAG: hypothetical protein M1274_06830 [Actinobacteria bacterium]|nr:hypothetical protein [Actinomycetota bacterium]
MNVEGAIRCQWRWDCRARLDLPELRQRLPLLTAAPRGGEATIKLLEELMLCHAIEETLGERPGPHRLE